nr:hypothetical protein [Tanacetum cinerariifolium]
MTTLTFAKTHNLIPYLAKPTKSEGFEQIIDFLNGSSVRYVLTASPTIRTSCIKQFWSTAKVKTVNDELRDMSHHQDIYDNPSLIKKVFANMKRVGTSFSRVITPLFENMLVSAAEEVDQQLPPPSNDPIPTAKDSLKFQELMDLCTRLSNKVWIWRVRILKEKSLKSAKVDVATPVKDKEESFKQGRMIEDMNKDVEVNLEETQAKAYNLDLQHSEKVLNMQDIDEEEPAKVEKVLEVVVVAKQMNEVVTTAVRTTIATQVPKAKVQLKDKGKGILIKEPKPLKRQAQIKQDEAFVRQLEAELNANINWNDVIEQVKRSERQNKKVMRYQALKRKPLTEAQARKNMMIYLKNMDGFKMKFFKGMTYSEIRPLFEKHYNSIQVFLEKEEERVMVEDKEIEEEGNKRQGESLEQEKAKKQRVDEKAEALKRHLQIVANDADVYIEANPLASKVPVVDF